MEKKEGLAIIDWCIFHQLISSRPVPSSPVISFPGAGIFLFSAFCKDATTDDDDDSDFGIPMPHGLKAIPSDSLPPFLVLLGWQNISRNRNKRK